MQHRATPIYASTLHRRDRAWGMRRRGRGLWRVRFVTIATTGAAVVLVVFAPHAS